MASYLLDTNIVTAILRQDKKVANKLEEALRNNATIFISPIVFYEIMRGLYHKDAKKQFRFFTKLADTFTWCDMRKSTWDLGAKFWATIRSKGSPTGASERLDADSLIAAQAQENEAIVVTSNVKHFVSFGVPYESW